MLRDDETALRSHGLRVTRPRMAVLHALDAMPHADAEHVHRALSDSGLGISLQSVHNVLADLHRAGLVRRFEPARSAAKFERRVDDNHHHAVCVHCGRIEDIDCVVGAAPCLHADAPSGFRVDIAEVTFLGVCATCAAAPELPAAMTIDRPTTTHDREEPS